MDWGTIWHTFGPYATPAALLAVADRTLRRPRLKIAVDVSNQPWLHGLSARWLRLSLVNGRWKKEAKNVRVDLVGLDEVHGVDVTAGLGFGSDSRPLVWTHDGGSDQPRNLRQTELHRVDVVISIEKQTDLELQTPVRAALPTLSVGKDYLLTIKLSGDNISPRTERLKVSCARKWSDLTGSLW